MHIQVGNRWPIGEHIGDRNQPDLGAAGQTGPRQIVDGGVGVRRPVVSDHYVHRSVHRSGDFLRQDDLTPGTYGANWDLACKLLISQMDL
jgi:hypothetical protein